MSYGERQKIALELRKRLVRQLAAQLDRLLLNEEVDNCYLAASKEINHPLVNELSARSQAKIVKNISADLTKVDKRELLEHFSE